MKYLILPLAFSLVGCGHLVETASAPVGAVLGDLASGGKKWGAPLGAALSVGGAKLAVYEMKERQKKSYTQGYQQGQADTLKQGYWSAENSQLPEAGEGGVELYPIRLPEHVRDGALVQPSTQVIPILR